MGVQDEMIIILDGLDKCGKSTLARKLASKYKAKLIHVSAPKTTTPFNEYVSLINSLDPNSSYVFDRLYLGECAYGEVYRKKNGLTAVQQYYLELMLLKFNPMLIYCWLDYNELTWNFHKDKEKTTKLTDVPRLDRLFRTAFNRSILPKTTFCYNLDKEPIQGKGKTLKLGFSYLGHPNPDVLFVGDEPNYRRHLINNIPYSVFNSTSGFFLIEALGCCQKTFGVVNSKEGHWLLGPRDIEEINPNNIVCLGLNSLKRISRLKLKVKLANHPQFAKRFYGKDALRIYANELKCGGENVS